MLRVVFALLCTVHALEDMAAMIAFPRASSSVLNLWIAGAFGEAIKTVDGKSWSSGSFVGGDWLNAVSPRLVSSG